jgi:hypothetical protein
MGWGPLWEPVLTVPEEDARRPEDSTAETEVSPDGGSPRQSPRGHRGSRFVAKVTTWLLDSVFGPSPPKEAEQEKQLSGWLQPLVGSATEASALDFMEKVDGVLNVPKQRRKRTWRDALLHATVHVQSACQSRMQTLCQTEMAQAALQNRWIAKIVDSPMVPMQLKHWGNFVLSPGTVETIHEESAMEINLMKLGTMHFDPPGLDKEDDLIPRSWSAPVMGSSGQQWGIRRNASVDKSLCYLA